jgi:hypothetical protein
MTTIIFIITNYFMIEEDYKKFSSLNLIHSSFIKENIKLFPESPECKYVKKSYCFSIFPHSLYICKWTKQHLLFFLLNFSCELISDTKTIRAPLTQFIIKVCLILRMYRSYLQLSGNYQLNHSGILNYISHE